MHSGLTFKQAIDSFAHKLKRNIFISTMFIFMLMDETNFPAFFICIFHIHGQKHGSEIFRIVPASAGNYCYDCTTFVIFVSACLLVFELRELFQNTLCFIFIIPKIRSLYLLFQFIYLFLNIIFFLHECLLNEARTYFIKNSGETLNVKMDSVLRKRFLGKRISKNLG